MGVKVREKVKYSGEWWIFSNQKGKRRSKKIGDKRTANNVAKKVRQRLAAGDFAGTISRWNSSSIDRYLLAPSP